MVRMGHLSLMGRVAARLRAEPAAGTYRPGVTWTTSAKRRRPAGMRLTVAVGLLAAASIGVGIALAAGAALPLGIAAVATLALGVAATLVVTDELTQVRRSTAAERVRLALDYQQLAATRQREDATIIRRLAQRATTRDMIILRLRRALRMALRRMDEAEDRAQRNAHLVVDLRARVYRLQLRVDAGTGAPEPVPQASERASADEIWDDAPTVVDLVGWDQRASETAAESAAQSAAETAGKHLPFRKHA